MDIINTTTKIKIIETLLQNKKSLGISSIANHAKISVSEIWRQISVLIDYGLIIEENRGPMGRYKKYKININNPLVNIVKELFDQYEKIRKFIHLKPLDACSQFLKKYYITGAYAIKEASWDIFYSDGMMVAVDPKEYEKAKLLKNCYINRWNFILLKKPIEKCDYFYDEDERVFKATFEQAIADSIGSYQLDPNNIEILYFLLVENLD
ncbi:MAG TPA: HTH domain-containing protein, partial [Candidatus Deferrimicrobium sp.]|nr:HTH domain-containing protein [Candidatus Deferrimicrobium sp.]